MSFEKRSTPRVACVGIAGVDLIHHIDAFPSQPVKLRARAFSTSVGGMAAGAACAVARLGTAAQYWGPVGTDAFGDMVRVELERAGVDASWVPPVAGADSSHSVVIVDAAGERLLVNHRGSALASTADVLPLARLDAQAVVGDVRWPAGVAAMLASANGRGIPTVLDAEMGDAAALRLLVPLARHVIFSEPGFAEWTGGCSGEEPLQPLQALVRDGAQLAAITRGARSILYATAHGSGELPAFDVTAVETLGAGDVFHGAYGLAIAEGRGLLAALRFAAAAAALKCTRRGGRAALPDRAEVDAFLAERC